MHEYSNPAHQAAPFVIPPCLANSLVGESQPGVAGLDILKIVPR